MANFKRYIKNIFSIAGVEWRDGKEPVSQKDGLVVSQQRNNTAADRSIIADEQYLISLENMAKNILVPLIEVNLDPIYRPDPAIPATPFTTMDTNFGNWPAGSNYFEVAQKSISYILDKAFFLNPPAIVVEHSDLVQLNGPADIVEVGETIQFDVTAAHIRGFIQSADGSPIVELVGGSTEFDFTDFTGTMTNYAATSNAQNHLGDISPALLGEMIMKCDFTFGAGNGDYFWEDSVRSFAFETLRAGDINSPGLATAQISIRGQYNMFFGSGALASAPVNPAAIRALGNGFLSDLLQTEIELTLPAGDVEMYFYVPDTYTIDEIFHYKDANLFVGDDFVSQIVPMEDGGGNVINYTEFKLVIGGIGFLSDQVYKIKVTP